MTGNGPSHKERLQQIVTCPDCPVSLHLGSLRTHRRRLHGIDEIPQQFSDDRTDLRATTAVPYQASFPKGTRHSQICPVPNCLGHFKSPLGLRTHFMTRHPNDKIRIAEEGGQPLTQCTKCGMHVPYTALNKNHTDSRLCKRGAEL
jgi:hypothetical protein